MSDYCGCGARPPEHPNHDCERCDWIVKVDALQRENDELRSELHRRSKKRDWLLSMVADIQGKCAVLRHENNKLRAENDRLRRDAVGPYRKLFYEAINHVDSIFQKCKEVPDPILPDFAEPGENKFEACVRLAEAYAAERDQTPVTAEWLDRVPGLSRIATLDGWWESENKQVVVELFKETGKSLIRFRTEFHGKIYEGGIGFVEPTRGDVLTALRLFGGEL